MTIFRSKVLGIRILTGLNIDFLWSYIHIVSAKFDPSRSIKNLMLSQSISWLELGFKHICSSGRYSRWTELTQILFDLFFIGLREKGRGSKLMWYTPNWQFYSLWSLHIDIYWKKISELKFPGSMIRSKFRIYYPSSASGLFVFLKLCTM